jgi:hypothetical protein
MVVYRPGDGRGATDLETRRKGKSESGQKTNCAAARSREGGLFHTSDETTGSKIKTASAQILRESISYVKYFSSGEKHGDGADDQHVGADSAECKRGGVGSGSEAHGQIDAFEERFGSIDESASAE